MSTEHEVVEHAGPGQGFLLGVLGVLGFSFSLPATRLAVEGLDPWLVAFGRAAGAGLLAVAYLWAAGAGGRAWFGFGYVTVVSMYLAFFAWYAGLARGGVARIGQVQLAQPVLTLLWSAVLLGEQVDGLTVVAAFGVLACVVLTQRTRERGQVPVGRPR